MTQKMNNAMTAGKTVVSMASALGPPLAVIPVFTYTTAAPGVLGWLGFTTVATVGLPVFAIAGGTAIAAGAVAYVLTE